MDGLREYVLSVVAAAVLCAILSSIAEKSGSAGKVLHLVCRLFLTFTVISPVAEIPLDGWQDLSAQWEAEAAMAVQAGEEAYQDSLEAVIRSQVESYILDKARQLGAEISVEVLLDENQIPEEVVISGRISPYLKGELERYLTSQLGIAKERQIWIGS